MWVELISSVSVSARTTLHSPCSNSCTSSHVYVPSSNLQTHISCYKIKVWQIMTTAFSRHKACNNISAYSHNVSDQMGLIKQSQTLESIFSANFLFGSTICVTWLMEGLIPYSTKAINYIYWQTDSLTELTVMCARAEEWRRKLTNQPSGVIPNQWKQPQEVEWNTSTEVGDHKMLKSQTLWIYFMWSAGQLQ